MNVGIVGCGRVTGLRHLPALARNPATQVVALADVDRDRAEALARRHGVAACYPGHEELLADERVEAVAVCVPAARHAEVAVPALAAGKHVLIEKPLALSLDDAERTREAATGARGAVVLGFNLRWHRLVRRARELVLGGAVGELETIRTVFTSSFDYRDEASAWRMRRESGGGALWEMVPHHLDLWRFVTGREVDEVFASSRSGRDEDDTAVIAGVLEGGARADTLVSQRTTNVNEIEVFGDRGRLRVSCYRYDGLEVQLGRGFGGDARHRLAGLVRATVELPAFVRGARGRSDYHESYAEEWRHFVRVAAGEVEADPGIEDGVRNVEVIVAALESLESGKAQPVARSKAALPA